MNNSNKNLKTVFGFLLAQSVSLLGSSLVQYAIIWHITLSTSSGFMLTISTVCGFLPQIFVSLFGGAMVDRFDRKKVIMITDAVIATSTLFLAIMLILGYDSIWQLFAVLAIRSAGTGVQTPAVSAILPQITPDDKLMKINGIYSTLSSVTMFLSPALSGGILGLFGLEITLLVDVFTAALGILITAFLKIHSFDGKATSKSVISDIKEGFLYLKSNLFVKNLMIFQFIVQFLISPSAFLNPLLISRSFGSELWRLTAGEMSYSIGMILGGILISTWGGFKNHRKTIIVAGFTYRIAMIGLGCSKIFWIYLVINTIIGLTPPCYTTPLTVSIQERVSHQMQGRVFSFMQIASSCALPLGMVLFGPLADIFTVQSLLIVNGAIVTLYMIMQARAKACKG